uniref:induced myeloid leukemia cell differentiation protein Mcl-1 homolog n=1 Tax=Myxine glutinosa TaxID=7769 RepID=UPI00358E3B89
MEHDPLMRETRSLIKAYIMHHVAPDEQQVLNEAAETLIRIGDTTFNKNRETLEEMVQRLYLINRDLSDVTLMAGIVTRVAEQEFIDGVINWERLVAVIILLAKVAEEFHDRDGTVEDRVEVLSLEMSRFVVEHLGDWIRGRGGW